MITIRKLLEQDMRQAMELKALCWTEELAGLADDPMNVPKQLRFWLDWMHTAQEHNDIRLLIGAFEDGNMLGVAFASLADDGDIPQQGIELNGLWVYPEYRGKGVSLRLIQYVLDFFSLLGMEQMVIYCFHHAPSNAFYKKFGAQVNRQEYQMDGRIPVDVFLADIGQMKERIAKSLSRREALPEQAEK